MITRVELENWRSHSKTAMDFLAGTNVLVGVMGAGKSSVLDAISFALFGTFPALNSKKLAIDDCILNKPEQKTRASVRVHFTAKGKNYSILREAVLGKGTTRSELRESDRLIEGPQTKRVTEEIEKLLGMDYDLFSRAVYSEQNQMDHFLQIPSGQRKRKIDELLNIDRFEEARKNASLAAHHLRDEAEALRQMSSAQLPDIDTERTALSTLESETAAAKRRLEAIAPELSQAEAEVRDREMEKRRLEELARELKLTQGKAEAYRVSQMELEKTIAESSIKDPAAELNATRSALDIVDRDARALESDGSRAEKQQADRALALAEAKERELAAQLSERQRLVEREAALRAAEPEKRLAELKSEKDRLSERVGLLEAAIAAADERLARLASAGDNCPVCDSEITHDKRGKLETDATSDRQRAQSELAMAKQRLRALDPTPLETAIRELDRNAAKIASLATRELLSTAEAALTRAKSDKATADAKAAAAEEKLKELRARRETHLARMKDLETAARNSAQLERLKKEQAALARRIEELSNATAGARHDETALSAARERTKALSVEVAQLRTSIASIEKQTADKRRLIAEFETRAKMIQETAAKAESLRESAADMDIFKNALEDTQAQLRERFITGVNDALGMVWNQIYPYGDYPRVRLGIDAGDYTLQVMTLSKEWVDVDGFASGGERSTAALALRIAFSMVLAPQLSWLVLDEPTHNLDTNGVASLSTAMRERLPALVDQIFVITHDEELETAATGNLYRLERDKGSDGATSAVLVSSGKD